MIVSMIAAVAANKVIGKDNDLVWSLPDDMRHFVTTTKGRHVIMGRKNYDSIPEKFRPLPNRPNIVLTHQKDFKADQCIVLNNLKEAIELASKAGETEAFIIGGAQIYAMGLEIADRMYLTEIEKEYDGDTHFPDFDKKFWKEVSRIHHAKDDRHESAFDFVVYDKIK